MSASKSANKMLIDATHPEETRVVVLRNGRVEEFDFESAARKLLRGNIYLAKVTRVEPSLQAAFVDYGGNRHGFLAFNEIHPDYYQIPVADRQALIDEEAAAEAAEEAEADAAAEARSARDDAVDEGTEAEEADAAVDVALLLPPEPDAPDKAFPASAEPFDDAPAAREMPLAVASPDEAVVASEAPPEYGNGAGETAAAPREVSGADEVGRAVGEAQVVEVVESSGGAGPEQVENVGSDDALEEVSYRPRRRQRSYKIQEVIKRRQIILVQVVKEERGNKGAALTTYLSLAGRYTVLMPNTGRGGGISRKITNAQDRKRLKSIAHDLEVPEGMGLIIRTAGASRTKQEIKRDFEYLLRLWESVRELTLQSTAPSLVYEEGDLIKRSIRDLYTKDVEEIVVAGEVAHRDARDFMRMLMPSHAKNVNRYEDPEPLFSRYQIERQLNAMFSPYVHLRSGGYLVINQAEALVAIDVNSGKATREFSIEETALNTNLEAADEIARQLKLRDLAGLIVIDFIDMEEKRNNRAVERRLKEALRFDRARIQVGHISHFGLLEMSRQRLRTGVLEGSTSQCPHCQGTGIIRSTESVALAVIRGIEDTLMSGQPTSLTVNTTATVALYILNNKRAFINEIESRHGIAVTVKASDKLQGANFTIERAARAAEPVRRPERAVVNMNWGFGDDEEEDGGDPEESPPEREAVEREPESLDETGDDDQRSRRRRRRRGRRGERGDGNGERDSQARRNNGDRERGEPHPHQDGADDQPAQAATVGDAEDDGPEATDRPHEEGDDGRRGRRGRRRGRRGGRRDREQQQRGAHASGEATSEDDRPPSRAQEYEPADIAADAPPRDAETPGGWGSGAGTPERNAEPAAVTLEHERVIDTVATATAKEDDERAPDVAPVQPVRVSRTKPVASEPVLERVVVGAAVHSETDEADATKPARKGWWQRKFGG
jgi:ribonuclease E